MNDNWEVVVDWDVVFATFKHGNLITDQETLIKRKKA